MSKKMKRIVILGSSGSIGVQTLDVVRKHADKLEVLGLAVHSSISLLKEQAREFKVKQLVIGDASLENTPSVSTLFSEGEAFELRFGPQALEDLVRMPEVDIVVNALVGAAGLRASYETLRAGKVLALANKESLVVGGDLIMPLATDDRLLPIDSEHGAIYQCLLGEHKQEVSRLWLTASGGPFRGWSRSQLMDVRPQDALAHPTWNMGAKITIDSSTLMNKGLEIIEAHHLFSIPYENIEALVQPQSVIHSMVEFCDGSVKAHLGTTDMRIPIQYALSYPERWSAPVTPLDFRELGSLEFASPDKETFPCIVLAEEAGKRGGTLPCVLNAANEVAVAAFLAERCSYVQIPRCIESVMAMHTVQKVESLEQLEEIDAWARKEAERLISSL